MVGAVLVDALLGLAATGLSTTGTLLVAVLGLVILGVLLFRRSLRPGITALTGARPQEAQAAGITEPGDGSDRQADPLLRIPRLLFYLGALTLAEGSWRPAAGLTVSEIFFILAFVATVAAVLAGRPMARVPKALVIGVAVFALGGLISSVGAANVQGSVAQTFQGIYVMLLWVWTGATVLRNRSQILIALTCWTISSAFDGFAATLQVAHITALGGPLEGNRATGLTDHPNDLGAACAVALVPALMLATSRLPGRGRGGTGLMPIMRWSLLALTAAGVVFSASVSAMFAGLIAILIWLAAPAVRAPGRLAVVAALALSLIALTLAGGAITSPTERLQEVTTTGVSSSTGSGGIRLKTVERAWPRIESNPIVGRGLDTIGSSVYVINQGNSVPLQVHGAPVAIWYQAGFLGLVGVVIVVWCFVAGAWRSLLSTRDQADVVIGLSIFAAFIAFFVYAMTAPFVLQQYGWFTGVMLLAWRLRRDAVSDPVVPRAVAPSDAPSLGPSVRALPSG
jgi:O-antigen ligase